MSPAASHTINNFATLYYSLRKLEGRIYSDEEVSLLPVINKEHKYYQEWIARKASCDRLVRYLVDKKKDLEVLEVGCGNGWLSARLAAVPGIKVMGIDVNREELEQANRVFGRRGLKFFNCSLDDELMKELKFDMIVFAASIQYFSSLENVLDKAINLLKPGGEVHIIDSNFYSQKEMEAARQRTSDYYQSIGFPEMIGQYFHHPKEELVQFKHEILYDPGSLINCWKTDKNPFYWIKINA
jgi:ubiquinone/menaquinone biosynthesis C-methylase UbiE